MTYPRVAVIVSTSSVEKCFLDAILLECAKFAAQVVVTYGTARYDGTPEVPPTEFVERYPNVRFIGYQVEKEIEFNPLQHRPHAFWHNISRISGMTGIMTDMEWVLFLDGDEVPEGDRFREWLSTTTLDPQSSYTMANYWYFKDVCYQATKWEESIVMVPHAIFRPETTIRILMQDNERHGIAYAMYPNIVRNVVHHETQTPMFHHFSWCRSKQGILEKVRSWGHKNDDPWEDKINDVWDKPFVPGVDRDFVHGYEFVDVGNKFSIFLS